MGQDSLSGFGMSRRAKQFLAALTVALAMMAAYAATSYAAYHWCSNCWFNAHTWNKSAGMVYATSSYVHRLSGPGSGVYVGAAATNSGGAMICSHYTYGTEASCYPGGAYSRGWGLNDGNGNYRFNAHLGT